MNCPTLGLVIAALQQLTTNLKARLARVEEFGGHDSSPNGCSDDCSACARETVLRQQIDALEAALDVLHELDA